MLDATVSYADDNEWVYSGPMDELMSYQKGGVLENKARRVYASGDFKNNTVHGVCKMVVYTDHTIRMLVGEFREGRPHGQIVETTALCIDNAAEVASRLVWSKRSRIHRPR